LEKTIEERRERLKIKPCSFKMALTFSKRSSHGKEDGWKIGFGESKRLF
jgi:hypothetical protein